MLKRLLTGICYLAVLIGFFLLKIFVHRLFFDALVLAFTVLGTFEMLRAFGEKIAPSQKITVGAFAPAIVLTYALCDEFVYAYAPQITFVVFIAGAAILFGMLVFAHERTGLESTGYAATCYLYPSAFLLVLSACNHLPVYSELAILFVFAVCPFADSLALVFGMLFRKKLPAKMAPSVSPNKTLIGGFGGLVGGALGAICIFFAYYGIAGTLEMKWGNLAFFVFLGILTAAFAEFGDLAESAIKRKLGIKDMGKLLPGHGGVLDRIDSTLYASLIVCFVFVLRIMTTG